ncbi:peptide/nickel transport system ATP-binding protein [Haloactinopolyspora alba]|uniref:Peptide/nickel transport system ATP-binding protein n=1 Tax=Haloactinopolyspora alba TaxID=648780 RepID=A0A2P8DZX4_9ACTN|nr:ABC transporter ATP-binding protein [Haloactinopolyspora alba]PSL02717.1 peptide/nickel transport system ATP-binding protein [Haloactinopolyspora alba]
MTAMTRAEEASVSQNSGAARAPGDSGEAVLTIDGLKTHYKTDEGVVRAVDGVDLTAYRGQTTCVVGESGCGKSVTARSILQLIDLPGKIADGRIMWQPDPAVEAVDLTTLDEDGEQLRRVRGGEIGMVFQEPMASLSPMYTVGSHLVETILLHTDLNEADAKDRAIHELKRVGIPQPERRFDAYPFQLSGGMCQRVMIALALSCEPALLIADEPTTALDVTTQARILDLLLGLQEETGMSMLFITHDLGVVAEIAADVSVMYLGKVVEKAGVDELFENPQHPYTQALLESIPSLDHDGQKPGRLRAISGTVPHPADRPAGCSFHPRCPHAMAGTCDAEEPPVIDLGDGRIAPCHLHDPESSGPGRPLPLLPVPPVQEARATGADDAVDVAAVPAPDLAGKQPMLRVRDLSVEFPIRKGFWNRTVGHVGAVSSVDLDIYPGETLGLVGESGCGKTTLGRSIVRALEPTRGSITYRPPGSDGEVDLAALGGRALRPYRSDVRMIFQDPFTSLNPRKTLLQLIGEPLRRAGARNGPVAGTKVNDSTTQDQVAEMLARVGLRPEYMWRYPHAFSGGQRQRVNIARALITRPSVVVADEAVSALDVSVRAQILNLLKDLQEEFRLTYLFISHDLSVVEHVCDRVAVMYLGRVVERADTDSLFEQPRHPYSEALLSAVPQPDPRQRGTGKRIRLPDDLPDPTDPPPGCRFHTRCRFAVEGLCDRAGASPVLRDEASHSVACLRAEEIQLQGRQ